jgi:hypothetical protein
MQFGAVQFGVRNNTQPHITLWTSEVTSVFTFLPQHNTKIFLSNGQYLLLFIKSRKMADTGDLFIGVELFEVRQPLPLVH